MTAGAAFLGGAATRLLPASIPLRFFGAAVAYHLAGWLALAAGARAALDFVGGPGVALAALHLFTLGMFGMVAMGAGAQLLPVATRQPAIGPRALTWIWWVYTPGVALLTLGMGLVQPLPLGIGAAAVIVAFASWAALVLRHLVGARGMAGVMFLIWAALVALAVLLVTAAALAGLWLGWWAPDRAVLRGLHLLAGPFGFMGLLALGLSCVLVPMFALSEAPADRAQLAAGGLAAGALVLAGVAAFGTASLPLRLLACAAGGAAAVLHVLQMRRALREGMRKSLGRSMLLVKIGWGGLFAAVVLGAVLALGLPLPRGAAWFGLSVIGVWLLSTLCGMLQRILPFLGAMHAPPVRRRAPTPSALTHERSLQVHFASHVAALALLALAIAFDSAWIAALGCAAGAAGAVAFASFYVRLLSRMRPRGA